ncbi:MAG: hypothetical protein SOZ84_08095 [Treponema sp.]|nr:hypothetical protein [Treponema sp.]
MKRFLVFFLLTVALALPTAAQSHTSVPLDDPIYYVIEQAQLKGLCPTLSEAKPYSQHKIKSIINIILSTEAELPWAALTSLEKAILQQTLASFEKEEGWNWLTGETYQEHTTKSGITMTFNAGASWQSVVSGSYEFLGKDFSWGTDNWGTAFIGGDMGSSFSWNFSAGGGLMKAPRKELGTAYTFYEGFENKEIDPARKDQNKEYIVFSEPTTFFPYTYQKNWDGSIFKGDSLSSSGFYEWPYGMSLGYQMNGEMAVSFLDDAIFVRAGRLQREWAAGTNGSSLALNASARPFFGVEVNFEPFSWLRMATLTGILEYYNMNGISVSSATFQNAFAIGMAEANYKNYLHFSFGSSAVFPKRFELGYSFPLLSRFFYQNNVGDFDNLAMFATLILQYPGIGKIWGSAYVDEMDLTSPAFFSQDRNMHAVQVGISAALPIPKLAFSNFTFQYTKIEPYVYTHQLVKTPWYDDIWMEEPYMNNGVSLGYYLPPNSDELKIRFDSSLIGGGVFRFHAQYQMVRHGAEYGSRAVDGSGLNSTLDTTGRNDKEGKPELWKYFLHDGAYQWQHIFKVGGEFNMQGLNVPLSLFLDTGVVYSYYTDIDGKPNSAVRYDIHKINTSEYPTETRFITTVGFKLYP